METWEYYKDSKKGVGAYFVSNQGRVKFVSLKGQENILNAHWRNVYDKRDGRNMRRIYIVRIGDDKVQLNSLVARFFVPNPKKLKHLVHRDGDKTNCAAKNLKWGVAVTIDEQIEAFRSFDMSAISQHYEFEKGLIDYILTRQQQYIEKAWISALPGLRTVIKGEIIKRRGFLPDLAQIDDCVQETYLLLMEKIETGNLRYPARLWGYLVALAKFVTCKHGRENCHISSERRNRDGEDYSLYDLEKYNDLKYAYTPEWGML